MFLKFKIEVLGGPQPSPPISYKLDDSTVAKTTSSGLITSLKPGYAKLIGVVKMNGDITTEVSWLCYS